MKQLICEMCGSADLVKADGLFVCQYCGCKYTVEEAKKMMIEGTVEIAGTVRVDDSETKKEQIKNYLQMAQSAFDGEDINSVMNYCDRILEIDMNNYEAWVLKAKSAGWGSSLNNIKIPQALTAAKRAVELSPDSKKYDIAAELHIHLKLQVFSLMNIAKSIPSGMMIGGLPQVHAVMLQWQSILAEIPYLSKSIMEQDIELCKKMCEESKGALSSANRKIYAASVVHNGDISYDKMFRETLSEKIKLEEFREEDFKAKAKAEADEKRKLYWSSHADEKKELEMRKAKAEAEKSDLEAEISSIPENFQKANLEKNVNSLRKEMESLGIFKGKEKKALQARIDEIEKQISSIKTIIGKKSYELEEKLKVQVSIINEVNNELNKER